MKKPRKKIRSNYEDQDEPFRPDLMVEDAGLPQPIGFVRFKPKPKPKPRKRPRK